MVSQKEWQKLIDQKREDRESQIPEKWRLSKDILDKVSPTSNLNAFQLLEDSSLLSKQEIQITEEYTAQGLLSEISRGELTAFEVCSAFCKRAAIAQQLTNCATEIFFDEALERAKELDDRYAREKKAVGPFHGLPISLKDSFHVKGQAATLGYVSFLKNPVAETNSPLVDILLGAGAVLFIKTNVPQTLMTMDSVNNVFGRTLNPYKLSLGAGGSSGGEGALVSFRGSIIGVGTDIGGSIRAPSLCCGIYGFKPTANRVPCGNQESAGRRGSPGILPSAGPHAHCATDLTFFFKTVIKSEPWKYDSTALAIPWRDAERKKSLNIGVYLGDDDYPLDPPITRAMISAMKKLQSAHHSVQVLTGFPPLNEAMKTVAKLFSLDNKKTSAQFIRDGCEKPIAALAYTKPTNLIEDREYILDDIWDANNELVAYREKVFRVWRAHDLDVLLCPGSRSTAKPHDTYGIPIYTSIWNLLDFPASVIPYLKADESLDSGRSYGYEPNLFEGAPCSVQVVGWRSQDEEVLLATETISEVLSV